jgi:antitoxin component of MazEF toxin-antitoxin module
MARITVRRWGKNLAIRFPNDIAKAAGLDKGQRVEVLSQKGEIIIRRMSFEITVDDLFRGKSPEAWRKIYSDACDWDRQGP